MNLYFVYGSGAHARLVTPALTGTLLPGITRDSLLSSAADLGYAGVEEPDQHRGVAGGLRVRRDHRGVRLRHRRGHHPGRVGAQPHRVLDRRRRRRPGPVTMQLREALLDIQTGAAADPHGWIRKEG